MSDSAPTNGSDLPSRGRLRIRVAIIGLGFLALVVATVAILHTPPVRRAAAGWIEARLGAAGIEAQLGEIDYGLLELDFEARDLRLRAAGAAEPFLVAGYLRVDIPWSAVFGDLVFESVELADASVHLTRDQEGVWNVPAGGDGDGPSRGDAATAGAGRATLPRIVRLRIERTRLEIEDAASQAVLELPRLDVTADELADGARLALGSPGTLRYGDRSMAVVALDGAIAWGGASLELRGLAAQLAATDLTVDGTLHGLLVDPAADLQIAAAGTLDEIAAFLGLGAAPTGDISLSARISGALNSPGAVVEVASARLVWQGVEVTGVNAGMTLSPDGVQLDSIEAAVAGGALTGRGELGFGEGLPGSVHLEVESVAAAGLAALAGEDSARLASELDAVVDASWSRWPPDDPAALEAQVRLTGRAPAVEGPPLEAPPAAARAGGLPVHGELELRLDRGVWQLQGDARLADVVRVDADLRGSLATPLAGSTLAGTLQVTSPDLSRLATALSDFVGDVPELAGAGRGELQLEGTVSRPGFQGSLELESPALAGFAADRLEARLAVRDGEVRLEDLVITRNGDQVTGNVRIHPETGSLAGRFQAAIDNPAGLIPGAPEGTVPAGRLRAEGEIGGTVDAPRIELLLRGYDLRAAGQPAIEVEARALLEGDTVRLHELVARQVTGPGRVRLAGEWDLASGDVEVQGDAQDFGVELASASGRDLRAQLGAGFALGGRLGGAAAGSGVAITRAALEVRALDGTVDGVPLRLLEAGTVEWASDALRIDGLGLGLGNVSLRLAGSYAGEDTSLVATLAGDLANLEPLVALATGSADPMAGLEMRGALDARLEVAGTVDRPRARGGVILRGGELAAGELPPLRELDVELVLQEGAVILQDLSATWQGADLSATGRLPLGLLAEALPLPEILSRLSLAEGAASLEARVGPLGPEAVRPFLAAETVEDIEGQIVATLAVTAQEPRLDALTGSLVLEQADVSIAGTRLTQREPTLLEFAAGRVEVGTLRWGGVGTEVRVTGSASLDPAGTIDLHARGNIDLRLLQLLLPEALARGTGELSVGVTGTSAAPSLAGGIDLRNAELRIPAAQLAFLDVTGRVALEGSSIIVEPVAGELNGGAFVLTGQVPAGDPAGGHLALTAVDVAVQPAAGFRSLLDLDLGLDLAAGIPGRLHGTVTITRGSYRERMSVINQFLDQTRAVGAVTPGASGSALDGLVLDLRIVTENDVVVDNNVAELALAADLEISGTLGAPGLTGRAEILPGGIVFLSGNRFRVEGGAIDFASVGAIEPEFDLTALTQVNDYQITLRISGTPEEPEVDLSSDPPLPESDVASLLLTGRTLERAESAQGDIAQEALVGLLAAELTGQLGEMIGLDSVRLERGPVQESYRSYPSIIATETDPAQRLTVAKRLRPDLELVFSQALDTNGGFTWVIDYEIAHGLEAEALFDDDNNRALQFGQQLTFGGGEVLAARSFGRDTDVPVAAVVVQGDSPLSPAELRNVVRLEAGDRFDFFRWQEDRERLVELHQLRGWLEVEVHTERIEVEDAAGSVRLVYSIATGPRTSIVVAGTDLPGDVWERIEEAWGRAVLDDFLLDEAAQIVRLHLVGRGFVLPTVQAAIDAETAGEKRLVLSVDPGPRTDELRLDFSGNRRLDAERLRASLAALDPPHSIWVDAAAGIAALEFVYAAEGMPGAQISVGEPRREGDLGVLQVEIVEGSLYRVGQVSLIGVSAIPVADAEAAARLAAGDPYVASPVAAAARMLEAHYRSRGYASAEVEVEAEFAPVSTGGGQGPADVVETSAEAEIDVPVTLRVTEGPIETVADIEVRGASITHAGIIDRALDLEVGDPADRNALALARKRLYDTGAFRRVGIEVEPAGAVADGVAPVRVVVSVGERPPYAFRYGLRLNSFAPLEEAASRQYEPGVSTELTSNNLFGRTMSAGFAGRYQPDFRIGRGFLTTPRFFGLPLISSVFVARSREELTVEFFGAERTDIIDVTELTFEQRFSLLTDVQVAYSYDFERVHTAEKDADPDDPFSFPIIIDVARLGLSGLVDRRDDPFDARRGWFHSSLLEYSATALGSDLPFAKYLLQQYYYRPTGPVTLASALRFGVAAAFDDQELIRSERFFAGGGNSVRGYDEDSLGPTGFFGPTGGNSLLELKQEVRFPIAWWFRGVGFVDAGNVFPTFGDISLGELKVGAGLGLRVDTPFALLRFDYGFALNRDPNAPRGRFFFSLGQAF